jgi:hypothetical protein
MAKIPRKNGSASKNRPWPVLPHQKRYDKGTQNETDYFRPDVLHPPRRGEVPGSGNIPFKAGHTDPHIAGIAQMLKQGSQNADGGGRPE